VVSGAQSLEYSTLRIHASRMIHFEGVVANRRHMVISDGYGDSVLQSVDGVLRDFGVTWDSAAILMSDFSQAVINIAGLRENLATEVNDFTRERMKAIDMSRSVARAVILDENEKFSRVPTPMSGFPEVLDRFLSRLAAAARIPVTILFGQAPAGLNATGDADIRHFYSRVRSSQTTTISPKLSYLLRVLWGKSEPEQWEVVWRPLWAATDLESAQARYVQAQADDLAIQGQVATPEEIARSRFGPGGYSFQTTIDLDARDQMEADRMEQEEARAQAEIEKASAPTPNVPGQPTTPGEEPTDDNAE
jgi:phage-related protein (TIGR01555 family)